MCREGGRAVPVGVRTPRLGPFSRAGALLALAVAMLFRLFPSFALVALLFAGCAMESPRSVPSDNPCAMTGSHAGCLAGEACVQVPECSACPAFTPACEMRCDTEDVVVCDAVEPDCGDDRILVVRDGCYSCVDPQTCE